MNGVQGFVLQAAALVYGCLTCASATRPALRLDDDDGGRDVGGRLAVSDGGARRVYDDAGEEVLLLPRTCGSSGVIELRAGTIYRTCPGHPDCAKEDDDHKVACPELHGAEGSRIEVSNKGINFTGTTKLLGPLVVTMAPSVESLSQSAIWSGANITLSSDTGPIVFENIRGVGTTQGASIYSAGKIEVKGLSFSMSAEAQNMSFDGGRFTFDGYRMSVPFMQAGVGGLLFVLDDRRSQPWGDATPSTLFEVDAGGSIHPAFAPWVALGVAQEVVTTFDRPPLKTCRVCHELAPNGEVLCHGGTHLQLWPGFMLQHKSGELDISVYRCPNQVACPGGNFSLTAKGQPQIRSKICAEGYDDSQQGCAQCLPGFGRSRLDPFKCERCRVLNLFQRVAIALSSSGLVYAMGLRSAAKPKTESQQVFKIFLSFITISCRCLSAIPYARDYDKLRDIAAGFVIPMYTFMENTGYAFSAGAGGDDLSVDCYDLMKGHASLALGMVIDFSVPIVLLVVAYFVRGLSTRDLVGFKEVVVWGNVFLPALLGSVAKCFPCVAMREDGEKFLVYEIYQNTKCAATFIDWLCTRRAWMATLSGGFLASIGPLLWFHLTAHSDAEKYSDDTGAHILALVLTVASAEMAHSQVRPYAAERFNRLEAPWPFVSPMVSLINLLALAALMLAAYAYLLAIYFFGYTENGGPAAGSTPTEAVAAGKGDGEKPMDQDGREEMGADDQVEAAAPGPRVGRAEAASAPGAGLVQSEPEVQVAPSEQRVGLER